VYFSFLFPVLGVIIFGLAWFLYKKTKSKLKKKTKTSSNKPVSVWFGFLEQKLVQIGMARFFSGFFSFRLTKPKPNRSVF
jgi:hypothetical protein